MTPKNITKNIADKLASHMQSFVSTIPNPNSKYATLGDREITLETVMDDPHVSSCVQSRKAAVLALEYQWNFTDANQQYKELIENIFPKKKLRKLLNDVLDAPLFGFAVLEVDWRYKYYNGQLLLLPESISSRPRDWFSFDTNQVLRLNNLEREVLPKYKVILVQNEPTYKNPYGKALLSKCLWPIVFKKADFTYWALFAENYGMPKYVGKTTLNRKNPDFNNFFEDLDALTQDGKIVIQHDESIEGLNPATTANVDVYDRFIDKCNSEISKVLLSETLTTELGDTGSFAASNTHADVKLEVRDNDSGLAEGTVDEIMFWIFKFNFPNIPYPPFEMFEAQDVDRPLAEVTEILERNKNIKFKEKFYVERFGFKPDEFEILTQQSGSPFPFTEPEQSQEFIDDEFWDQVLIDSFGDKLLKDDTAVFDNVKDKLKSFLDKHDKFESAIADIASLLPDLDSSELEKILSNALFVADVTGRLSVKKEISDAPKK